MRVSNLESPRTGAKVANQFIITENTPEGEIQTFQSYGSVIAQKIWQGRDCEVTLDETYWNYSVTTSKYRNQFLGETTKETKAKIDSGEYQLANLNN
jgi:hypothetical protein